jgi:hypothetical protein
MNNPTVKRAIEKILTDTSVIMGMDASGISIWEAGNICRVVRSAHNNLGILVRDPIDSEGRARPIKLRD